jgi:hypothetical protein
MRRLALALFAATLVAPMLADQPAVARIASLRRALAWPRRSRSKFERRRRSGVPAADDPRVQAQVDARRAPAPVPRAKYPVIDIHSHQSTPISPANSIA